MECQVDAVADCRSRTRSSCQIYVQDGLEATAVRVDVMVEVGRLEGVVGRPRSYTRSCCQTRAVHVVRMETVAAAAAAVVAAVVAAKVAAQEMVGELAVETSARFDRDTANQVSRCKSLHRQRHLGRS